MKKIYFLCTGNSCRSQVTKGYTRKYLSPSMFETRSTGIETHGLNPRAIKIMVEDSVDISKQTSDLIDEDYFTQANLIIIPCSDAKDKCPTIPDNHEHFHWDLKDPAQAVRSEEEVLAEFREIREGIKRRVLDLNQRTSIV